MPLTAVLGTGSDKHETASLASKKLSDVFRTSSKKWKEVLTCANPLDNKQTVFILLNFLFSWSVVFFLYFLAAWSYFHAFQSGSWSQIQLSVKQYDVTSHCMSHKYTIGLPYACVHVERRAHAQSQCCCWLLFESRDEKAFCDWGVSAIDQ